MLFFDVARRCAVEKAAAGADAGFGVADAVVVVFLAVEDLRWTAFFLEEVV